MAGDHLEFINKINGIIRNEQNQRIALTTVMSKHKPRIFEQGQAANKSKIGTYGKNPISIPFDKMARMVGSPRTVQRKKLFNAGTTETQTKSKYFPGGYAEYKTEVGKNPGYVILRNTDQMYMDYGIVRGGSSWGFGFQNSFNAQKAEWMGDKYNKDIFQLSDDDLNLLGDVLLDQINKGT